MSQPDSTQCAACGAVTRQLAVPGEDDGWLRFGVPEVRVHWLGSICPDCQAGSDRTEDEWMIYIAVAGDVKAGDAEQAEALDLSRARAMAIGEPDD
jgi:hypothetical protein